MIATSSPPPRPSLRSGWRAPRGNTVGSEETVDVAHNTEAFFNRGGTVLHFWGSNLGSKMKQISKYHIK